ncbi:MAG: glycosyltransferase family 39 protein [Chthoniobacter sp.]|nr:glycosyltransferase family 39 protein [Chthoniobacter sp.]
MSEETRPAADAPIDDGSIPPGEKRIGAFLLCVAFLLRCFYVFRYRYDSDEPQHLHTTWGWTQGLLQYRDFFDNHTPLFHILFSPLVAALGERTNILDFMRLAMVPLWLVSLWCVWRIAMALFSRRAALWATVFISLLPWWFFCAVEYRTDNLWTPLWLGAVATLVGGRFTKWRAFLGGLLLGLCFTVSLKTTLLCAVLVMAVVFTLLICARRLGPAGIGRILATAWPVLLGMVIAPAILVGFFAMKGALDPFIYGTIKHNLVPDVDAKNHPSRLRLTFWIALPFLLAIAAWIAQRAPDTARALRRAGVFLVAGLYYTALYTFWTLLTRQDYLPFYPLAMVLLAPLLIMLARRFLAAWSACVLAGLGVLLIILVLAGRPPWIDGTQREREILAEVLKLTKPGEYVMDFKGESVFRQRAFFYVTEPLTFVRMRRMIIADTVAEDLVAKKVCVVLNQDRWYPKNGAKFMTDNYLAVGRMRVAGKVIAPKPVAANETVRFDVAVPASYVIWADGDVIPGALDGTPNTDPRELAAGPHEFQPAAPHGKVAIYWSRAAEAGFQPLVDQPGWQDFR